MHFTYELLRKIFYFTFSSKDTYTIFQGSIWTYFLGGTTFSWERKKKDIGRNYIIIETYLYKYSHSSLSFKPLVSSTTWRRTLKCTILTVKNYIIGFKTNMRSSKQLWRRVIFITYRYFTKFPLQIFLWCTIRKMYLFRDIAIWARMLNEEFIEGAEKLRNKPY